MKHRPFTVQRPPFFSIEQLERIEEAALQILEKVGIAVLDETIQKQLSCLGYQIKDNGVLINRKLVSEFLDAERKRN